MNYTPMQRRERIQEIMESDAECRRMMNSLDDAKREFEQYVSNLPEEVRSMLWEYPGMAYFLHNRILNLTCAAMRFPDEQ